MKLDDKLKLLPLLGRQSASRKESCLLLELFNKHRSEKITYSPNDTLASPIWIPDRFP